MLQLSSVALAYITQDTAHTRRSPGDTHQHVHLREGCGEARNKGLRRGTVAHVKRHDVALVRAKLVAQRLEPRDAPARRDDAMAVRDGPSRDRVSKPGGGASDQKEHSLPHTD